MDLSHVRFVALWLRKSRGDEETALEKHRSTLVEIAQKAGWEYEVYQEIGTSQDIEWRPEMKRFLADVQKGLFDAVLAMDLDRFSRGEVEDWGRWQSAFKKSKTLIVTPMTVYDLANDQNELMVNVQSVFARYEYQVIKKRLMQGKHQGAKLGRWTNGTPPIPYRYDREHRQLVVDPDLLDIYNLIKKRVLENRPLYQVAVELNRMGIPSPKGKVWSGTTLHRLITSEVHLGKIIRNKVEGGAHKNRKTNQFRRRSRDEWLVAEGSHPPVKTIDEHSRILELMERRRIIPKMARRGTYELSGLVRCGLCGNTMQFLTKDNGTVQIKKCQHMDPYGKACTNRGAPIHHINSELRNFVHDLERQLAEDPGQVGGSRVSLESQLKARLAELRNLEAGVDRIQELYIDGQLSKVKKDERLAKQQEFIRAKRDEVAQVRELLKTSGLSNQERLDRVLELKRAWDLGNVSPKETNRLWRQIVDRVIYSRTADVVSVTVIGL